MLLTQYVTYVLLGYIIGGLHGDDSDGIKNAISALSGGAWIGLWMLASATKVIIQCLTVMESGKGSALILEDRMFTMIQALSVFCIFKKYMDNVCVKKMAKSISRCSFGIYLIHPFFINLLYKMMKITPTSFPLVGTGTAILLLWFLVFVLSWGVASVMLKIPGLKEIL